MIAARMAAKQAGKKAAKKQMKKQMQKQMKKKMQQKVEEKMKEKAQDRMQEMVQDKLDKRDAKKKEKKKKKKKKTRRFFGPVKMDLGKELGLEDVEFDDVKEMMKDQIKGGVPGVKRGLGGRGRKSEEEEEVEDEPKRKRGVRLSLFAICRCIGKLYRYLGKYIPCFRTGTFSNQIFKNVVSFLCGVLFLMLFYPVLVLAMKQDPRKAAKTIMVLAPFICFGMAFSRKVRCIMLLILPQLFSGKGRTILMAYGFLLVLSGPVENLSYNMDVAGHSQICGSELAMNQSYKLFQVATSPMASFVDQVTSLIDTLRAIADRIKKGFQAIKEAVEALGEAVQEFLDWVGEMVDDCNERLGIPEKRCRSAFEHASKICRRNAGIFGFVCGIVDLISHVCLIAALLKLLCIFPKIIVTVARKISDAIDNAIDKLKEEFYMDFEFTHDISMDYTFSQTTKEIKANILNEMEQRTETFLLVVTWLNRLMSFTFLFLLFKAYKYYRGYLVKDKYDNWYVTEFFERIDERREEMGKDPLLPLSMKERRRYITPGSVYLAKPEKRKFIRGFVMWITQVGYAAVLMIADYTAYWFLDFVRMHSELNVHINAPGAVALDVQGDGILAEIYRTLVSSLDPKHISNFDLDTSKCLPHPSPPDIKTFKVIGTIYGICLFLVIFEAYGLRLRRIIMSKHYPERERVRAVWLYNQVLRRRGGFKKFLLKNKKKDKGRARGDDSFVSHLASRSKIWAMVLRLCGFRWKFCSYCGMPGKPKDMEGFVYCDNAGCPGVYCLECVSDINNMCQICSRPVDYSVDTYMFNFERPSSEEDEQNQGGDEENPLSSGSSSEEDLDYSYQYKSAYELRDDKEKPHQFGGAGGELQFRFLRGKVTEEEQDSVTDGEIEDEEEEEEETEEDDDQTAGKSARGFWKRKK